MDHAESGGASLRAGPGRAQACAEVIESQEVTGRTRKSDSLKASVTWWFGNDDEQQLPDWYHPEWEPDRRRFYWYYLRNPLQNFRCYVIGVQDRNYTVTGRAPVLTVQRDDIGEIGWQWCFLHRGELSFPLPFISYSGRRVVFQLGWQPSGFATFKLTIRKEPK